MKKKYWAVKSNHGFMFYHHKPTKGLSSSYVMSKLNDCVGLIPSKFLDETIEKDTLVRVTIDFEIMP